MMSRHGFGKPLFMLRLFLTLMQVHYLPSLRCFASCSADSAASLVLGEFHTELPANAC